MRYVLLIIFVSVAIIGCAVTGQLDSANQPPIKVIQRSSTVITDSAIANLVNQLAADEWQTREEATHALIKMGPSIKSIIKQVLQDNDPEIRNRARLIIQGIGDFRITSENYNQKDNLEEAVKEEFGPEYKIADWQDILANKDNIELIIKQTQWKKDETFLVTCNGCHLFEGSERHYLVARFDHKIPKSYLAHDNIDNNLVSLGSWYGLKTRILCVWNGGK